MNNNYSFYNWFQKIISICIDIFFVGAVLATIYVFTSPFSGWIKYLLFVVGIIGYGVVYYFFRDYIYKYLNILLGKVSKLDKKKMAIIIFVTMLIMKIIYTMFFNFDATDGGDIEIYNNVAEQIINTGIVKSNAISHLYGVALHFVVFKLFNIHLHVGLFIFILIGTLVNFYSFSNVIGKDKAFLAVMFYIIMPSTSLLSLCPTHEVIFYAYISLTLLLLINVIKQKDKMRMILISLGLIITICLGCLVNPGGMLVYIIMGLLVLFTNIELNKKALLAGVLILSIISGNIINKVLDVDEYVTTMNTYTILIHGSNPDSLGEQVDGYPLKQMRMYIYERKLDFSKNAFMIAGRNVLMRQYKYLLLHPITFIKMIIHKVYILWSGVHYPIELTNHFGALSGILYYILLGINTLIYLLILTIGLSPNKDDNDIYDISIYKLEFLGVFALTMLCVVLNKYSIYATIFIYLISFYRIGDRNEG